MYTFLETGEIWIVFGRAKLLSEYCHQVTHGHISSSSSFDVANPRSLLSVTTFRGSVQRDMASALHLLASAVVREPQMSLSELLEREDRSNLPRMRIVSVASFLFSIVVVFSPVIQNRESH